MDLGAFSISLTVKDIVVSKAFYEKLGFTQFGGELDQNWLIMKNGDHIIGLFEGMFESNILTFNPGWDQNAEEVNPFTDVRHIQDQLSQNGISVDPKIESKSGPASFMLTDPDGNQILIDQHR